VYHWPYHSNGPRPLLVSRSVVAVGSKCRPIRLLSRAVSCTHHLAAAEDCLSHLRTRVCWDTKCDLTFVPPTPAPPSKTIIVDISPGLCWVRTAGRCSPPLPLVCVRVCTAGRCPRWWFWGTRLLKAFLFQSACRQWDTDWWSFCDAPSVFQFSPTAACTSTSV